MMAQQTTEKQTIKEFINNLVDDLETGRITPEAAIIAAGQYEGLRKALVQHVERLASSTIDGDGLSVETVAQILRAVSVGIDAAPAQFQAEKPDAPLSPKEVLDRAGALRSSENIAAGSITRQQKHVAGLRKTFIERLVANWIARSRSEIEAGAIDESAIIKKLESLTDEELSGPNAVRAIESAFAAIPSPPRAIRDAASATDDIKQTLAGGVRALSVAREIPKALYPRAGLPNLERFTTIVTTIIASSDLPAETAVERADALSRMAEAVVDPREKRGGGEAIPTTFFTSLAQGPAQKFIAGAADAFFSQLSPLARQDVIRATFSRALEQALAKTDDLTTRLGKDFVESELFRLVMDGAKKEFARAPSEGSGSGRARGALDDIVSAILVGPVITPFLTNPRETLLAYFELLAVQARLPKGAPAVLPGKFEAAALLLAAASTGGAAPAGGAVASVLTAGASAFARQLPSWERFYLMMVSLVSPGVGAGQPPSSGASLPAFGSPLGGGLGGAVAGALSWVGMGLAGVAGRAGGGLVGLLFGGSLPSPFGRRTEKTSFWDDTPLMIAVFIGATIILLFIFPTFLNGGRMADFTKRAALIMGSQFVGKEEDFASEGSRVSGQPPTPDLSRVSPECIGNNFPKPSTDGLRTASVGGRTYAFPLAPYNKSYHTCGHHDGLDATDIGVVGVNTDDPHAGLAVVAYVDGTISMTVLDDPLGGKYVILNGDDGRSYYYAHNCALYVKPGDRVSAGQVIAASGDTGSAATTPEHVHFAISGIGSDFFNGGNTCPAADFEQKFGLGKCSGQQLCPSK